MTIETIPNGVDTSMFAPAGERTPRDSDVVRLICVGRLIERKGQQHLISAMAGLRALGHRVELLIVGTGDSAAALRRQVERLGLKNVVRFTGFVEWERMPELYQVCDIFVLPSYNEGMSIALLEAMAAGLPVVVTNTGGTRELIDGNGMIVPWGDVGDLTNALHHMIIVPDARERMSGISREIARRFGWEQVARRYLNLCERVAESAWGSHQALQVAAGGQTDQTNGSYGWTRGSARRTDGS